MAKIAEIVNYINTTLRAGQLSDARFKKGSFSGLAELQPLKSGETTPAIIGNSGETTKVAIDDVFPFKLYHRVISQTASNENTFGKSELVETYTTQLIVIGNKESLQISKEQVMTAIISSFPYEVPKTTRTSLGISGGFIQTGQWNTDKESVYRQEYGNAPMMLKPQMFLLSLSYTVEVNTYADCVEIC